MSTNIFICNVKFGLKLASCSVVGCSSVAGIELCHKIIDFLRIIKHFSDPKSVKIWRYNDGAKVKKEKKPT